MRRGLGNEVTGARESGDRAHWDKSLKQCIIHINFLSCLGFALANNIQIGKGPGASNFRRLLRFYDLDKKQSKKKNCLVPDPVREVATGRKFWILSEFVSPSR